MITIATVYKTGGSYGREYVEKLKSGFERHLKAEHRFVCLTDDCFSDYCLPLLHDWEGWWSKIELFRPGLFQGPVLAVDLDTVLLGDLSALLNHKSSFVMMRDFQLPDRANSCLMYWEGDHSHIYGRFKSDVDYYKDIYKEVPLLGDQAMIEISQLKAGCPVVMWQDILPPNFLINYQLEVLKGKDWHDASLCWWTWIPKPHEQLDHPMIKENWI